MEKRKLNYRFHNPNGNKETMEYIAKVFTQVGTGKINKIAEKIQESAEEG